VRECQCSPRHELSSLACSTFVHGVESSQLLGRHVGCCGVIAPRAALLPVHVLAFKAGAQTLCHQHVCSVSSL
jgi:hypothetical protein